VLFNFVIFHCPPLDPRLASLLCRSSLSCAMVAVMSHVQILETPSDPKWNYLIILHNYVACCKQPKLTGAYPHARCCSVHIWRTEITLHVFTNALYSHLQETEDNVGEAQSSSILTRARTVIFDSASNFFPPVRISKARLLAFWRQNYYFLNFSIFCI